jgi:centromere protein C
MNGDRRKSSIGRRHGPPKKRVPFRADDLRLRNKIGIAVQYVDCGSDEFEPFDEFMNKLTLPCVRSCKKSSH